MADFDVVVIGAGAAGMMCAIEAAKRGRSVVVLEHNERPAEKIRISGGGRCNFTNLGAAAQHFVSANAKFAISALSQFTQHDFIELLARYDIAWHDKGLGQLFCDESAMQVIDMLREEMRRYGAKMRTGVTVSDIAEVKGGYTMISEGKPIGCQSLVVACGGKSIPKMGASNFGYSVAQQFGLRVTETRPGLVPLTFEPGLLEQMRPLAGVSVEVVVGCGKKSFREAMLFTHRGLSGPAILQISSYWREGEAIEIDMAPDVDVLQFLQDARQKNGRQNVGTALAEILPKRLATMLAGEQSGRLADVGDKSLGAFARQVKNWQIKPTGTEGYRTAEVTLGGVDTRDLEARSLQARKVPGLFFVGEVVDVTGWLGGYNFQWAWSSGWAAGQVV